MEMQCIRICGTSLLEQKSIALIIYLKKDVNDLSFHLKPKYTEENNKDQCRNPREGNGTPLQYSCLETPMDGGAW